VLFRSRPQFMPPSSVQPSSMQPSPTPPGVMQPSAAQYGGYSYAPLDSSIPRSHQRIDPLMVPVPPTATMLPQGGYGPYGAGYGQGYPGMGYPGAGYSGLGYPGPYSGYAPGFGGLGGPGFGGWNGLNGLNGFNGLNNGPWSWMPFW